MDKTYKLFKEFHQQSAPLLIGNVWNVQSAKVFEKLEFNAIGTSSAAVAETLGYADGEEMSFEEYLFIIKRIVNVVTIPVSVDLEGGYGKTQDEIVDNIRQLYQIGIAGINLEDSVIENGNRRMLDAAEFSKNITGIVNTLRKESIDIFINLRSDVFLLGHPDGVAEAAKRTELYNHTGVDGLFFPCIKELSDIKSIVSLTKLPVNVMCIPGLPGFDELQSLGVKRISMGNFLNKDSYRRLETLVSSIQSSRSFDVVFIA